MSPASPAPAGRSRLALLTLGAIGVVYGDIGTSPLYAFREALAQMGAAVGPAEILGVLSLALWALIIVVTVKYVLFLTRADNHGEGGVLSLMALANGATGGRWRIVLLLGAIGAALFYGDAIITPALSVLSAVEGLKSVPGLGTAITPGITIGIALGILVALFAVQARGTAKVARLFGPVCIVWFVAIGALGLLHIADQPGILLAFNPWYGISLLATHGTIGLFVLGAVFLTVTGAEALIADMGHFGRRPIQLGWLGIVWPALTLNYLGQGALALSTIETAQAAGQPFANADWFFLMAPEALRAPLVILATAATIIASQAVITGAFSLTSQAIALGLLPRMRILQTAADARGQIYMPAINWLLLAGVVALVLAFRTSSSMAAAYGIAVTGTMVVTTCLAFVILWKAWHWQPERAALFILPLLLLDLFFFGANILRVAEGGWVPLLVGALIGVTIWSWMAGKHAATLAIGRRAVPIAELAASIERRPPPIVEGTAVFLTQDNRSAPSALLHSLKHAKALHARNLLLSVTTVDRPSVPEGERLVIEPVDGHFVRGTLSYGYMDRVDLPSDLARGYDGLLQAGGLSFYVGRNTLRRARASRLPGWMMPIYAFLHRNAADPTGFMGIPANRVVELGAQVEL
jgi:KUP system potassium uptake protein